MDISRKLLLQIKEMSFEALHGIVDCLWIVGKPIFKFKEAVESETGILIEIGSYDWITNLPISDDIRAHDRYDNNKLSKNCFYSQEPNDSYL